MVGTDLKPVPTNPMTTAQKVYFIVQQIPEGKVLTYKRVGELAGGVHPRVVGNLMHRNPDGNKTPCHRVVNSQGKIAATYAFGGGDVQQQILEQEGIVFKNGKIDLQIYMWEPDEIEIQKSNNKLALSIGD